jgi:hypothetical protein
VGPHLTGVRHHLHQQGRAASGRPAGAKVTYEWTFGYDSSKGWISSGFDHSPTEGYVDNLHGPLAFIPQNLPTGVVDFLWIFAIGGLGIALTLGIGANIAGWGGSAGLLRRPRALPGTTMTRRSITLTSEMNH